jgi:serine/threonine protein phosphatase PrpC
MDEGADEETEAVAEVEGGDGPIRAGPVAIGAAGISKIGGRQANEDAFGILEAEGIRCYVVADGLGGHRGGAEAARIAVDVVAEYLRHRSQFRLTPESWTPFVTDLAGTVQGTIIQEQRRTAHLADMRTTLTVLFIAQGMAYWFHVGDTRLYHFRRGAMLLRTRDHSLPEYYFRHGTITEDQIRTHPYRNRLLMCLGVEGMLEVEVSTPIAVEPGDAFLLCSDGYWELVLEEDMETTLRATADAEAWLAGMVALLEARIPPRHDNYTAVAVRC